MHDWYTSAGQGVGGEYRYNYGNGTDGNFNVHWLDQKETDVHARRRLEHAAAGAAAATRSAAAPTRASRRGFAPA